MGDSIRVLEAIQSVVTTLAIVIGGGWTFWKFVLQRESKAKIEFDVDIRVVGKEKDKILVEAIAIIANRGLIRHKITDFTFKLFYLTENDELNEGDEKINYQVVFNKLESKKRSWIPQNWKYTFIDPGVVQHYRYVTVLPGDTKYALLNGSFKYPKEKTFHKAQKAFNITEGTDLQE